MSWSPSAQPIAEVRSFAQAEEFLGDCVSRRIENNTYVERRDEHRIAVRLHQIDIVEFTRSGLITLSSGGFRTMLTKQRLGHFLPHPFRVSDERGVWKVTPANWSDSAVEFRDGVTFREVDGRWQPVDGTYPSPAEVAALREARKKVRKAVAGYVARIPAKVEEWRETLRAENGLNTSGDPWCCLMGVGAGSNEHFWSHIREGYVFVTLLRKAFEDGGRYHDPVQTLLHYIAYPSSGKQIEREVRKYLLKALDPTRADAALDPHTARAPDSYAAYAKEALVRPDDFGYFGGDEHLWVSSAPTWTKHRDSDSIEVANFDVVWDALVAEFPDLIPNDLDAERYPDREFNDWPAIYVFGASHWAVGHIDQIVVPVLRDPQRPVGPSNLHPAFVRVCEFREQRSLYPAVGDAEARAAKIDLDAVIDHVKGFIEDGDEPQARMVLDYLRDEHGTDVEGVARLANDQIVFGVQHFDLPVATWAERYVTA